MRKIFTKVLAITTLLFVGLGLQSCLQDVNHEPKLQVGTPVVNSAVSVDVPLQVNALSQIFYKVEEASEGQEAPSAVTLQMAGKVVAGSTKVLKLSGQDGLVKGKEYVVWITASISNTEFYQNGKVFSATFATPDYYEDQVQILSIQQDGANVYVTFPHEICHTCNRVKWGITDLATYNLYGQPVVEKLTTNDTHYPNYVISDDTLLEINTYNAYRRDENGNILYVDWMGNTYLENDPNRTEDAEPLQYHPILTPGTPCVLMLSEVEWADGVNVMPTMGWAVDSFGPGWYKFPFDMAGYEEAKYGGGGGWMPWQRPAPGGDDAPEVNEEDYWERNAWHKKILFKTAAPQVTDATVKVEFSDMSAAGGIITFEPNEKAFAWAVGIFPEESEYGQTWSGLKNDFLDGDESLMQWLSTSEIGFNLGFRYLYEHETENGKLAMKLYSENYDDLAYFSMLPAPGTKCHLIVTTVDGKMEDGEPVVDFSKQNFQHIKFTIPDYKKPAPKLEVTAVEPYSPYEVKFIVKNPDYATNPVVKVNYAAHYAREFDLELGNGYTYSALCEYAYPFDVTEVELINSAEGLEVIIPSRENATTRLAVMGWNAENRPSNPDAEGSKAVAEASTTKIPDAERVEFTKINGLEGVWTATATIKNAVWNDETFDYAYPEVQKSWKVTIGDLTSPASLSQEVYDLYAGFGVSKEQTDIYFAQFKEEEALYNSAVRGQNRILCQGFGYGDGAAFSTVTPWNLFLDTEYSFKNVGDIYYQFGMKWFLQEDAQGNVFIPVNVLRVPPLTAWSTVAYLVPAFTDADGVDWAAYLPSTEEGLDIVSEWPNIPVEVSADKQTITIKGLKIGEDTYYPNAGFDYGDIYLYYPKVVSEVVLTKGWTEPEPEQGVEPTKKQVKSLAKSANGATFTAPKAVKRASRMVGSMPEKKAVKFVEIRQLSNEQIKENLRKYYEKQKGIFRK